MAFHGECEVEKFVRYVCQLCAPLSFACSVLCLCFGGAAAVKCVCQKTINILPPICTPAESFEDCILFFGSLLFFGLLASIQSASVVPVLCEVLKLTSGNLI